MHQVYSRVAFVVMSVVCGAAWRWGGRLERRTAWVIAVAWVATLAVQRLVGEVAPVAALAAMDAVVFLLLLGLSWGDRAGWTVFAVAAQGVALGVHGIRAFSPSMSTWTYLSALMATSYGLLAALAWGVWNVRRNRGISS